MQRPTTAPELAKFLDEQGVRHVKVGVFDIDGVFRGKYLNRDKLMSAVDQGFGFCDVVLGWDSSDQLYDNTKLSGWHTGYRDAPVRLDLGSLRRIPFETDTALLLGSFDGDYSQACPRSVLSRVAARAEQMGFRPLGALEYEFFLFAETPHSARDKGYRDLRPFTPGMFGYSMLRSGVHAELYHEILDGMAALDCELEGLHTETGPGVLEAAIRYDGVARAGDKAALFKTFMKVLAQRRDLMATFMSKWSNDYPGQSGHVHLSLADPETGRNVFRDDGAEHGMSSVMRRFIAGQVLLLPELLAMTCSTVNSYRRLVPGFWAPTSSTWGVDNRTTAIRVILGQTSQRSEYRIAPADGNPYLVLAAALASGLWGIETGAELPPAVEGNAYEKDAGLGLPATLHEAAQALRGSDMARDWFGDGFVDHFVATREWEARAERKHVSDWDLARYFEII